MLDQQAFIYAAGPDGDHPGHRCRTSNAPGAGVGQHHAPDQRQEHVLDPAELPVRDATRTAASAARRSASAATHVHASRAAGHLHAADDPAPDAAQPVPDARRPRARADRQRLAGAAASSSPARSRAAARRAICVRTETHMNAEREPGVDEGPSSGPGRLPAAGLEPARLLRPHELRRHVLLLGLDAYAGGRPYSFIQQQGNGDLAFLEKQVGAYVKDDWQVRPGLSLSFGLRYDWQNYFHDNNNVAPRVSLAYAPGNTEDERDSRRRRRLQRSQRPGRHRRRAALAAGRPDHVRDHRPRLSRSVRRRRGAAAAAAEHRAARAGRADSADAAVQRRRSIISCRRRRRCRSPTPARAAITCSGRATSTRRRRRCISTRPDPAYGVMRQVESTGRQQSDSLQVTLRGKVTRWFNGQTQYTLSRAYNDTNGIGSFPANDYDLSGEWARADFDRRHRFLLLGRIEPGQVVDLGVGLTMNSGGPVHRDARASTSTTTGAGARGRRACARNSLETAGYASLDLRALARRQARRHGKDARAITLGARRLQRAQPRQLRHRSSARSARRSSASRSRRGRRASCSSRRAMKF